MEHVERTPVHRSLVRPVLLGGAERAPAIVNATTMLGIGLGPGFHWPNILLAAFLGTAVHMLLRWMAKRDPQFFAVYLRHLSYQPNYRHFADPDAPPARVYRSLEPYKSRRAGVPNRLVHDFRRTAVRNLERAGVPRSAAMKITGHQTETVYRRYAIVDEGMMREAAQKLAALHLIEGGQSDSKPILGQRGKV